MPPRKILRVILVLSHPHAAAKSVGVAACGGLRKPLDRHIIYHPSSTRWHIRHQTTTANTGPPNNEHQRLRFSPWHVSACSQHHLQHAPAIRVFLSSIFVTYNSVGQATTKARRIFLSMMMMCINHHGLRIRASAYLDSTFFGLWAGGGQGLS